MKQRNFALDIIRSLACLLVIIYHSAKPGVVNQFEAIGTALIAVPCVGLLFMVSGFAYILYYFPGSANYFLLGSDTINKLQKR